MKRKAGKGRKTTPQENFEEDRYASSDEEVRKNGEDSAENAAESKAKKRKSAGKNDENGDGAKKNRRSGRDSKSKSYQEVGESSNDEDSSLDQENSPPKKRSGRDSLNYDSTDEDEGEKQKTTSPKKKATKAPKTKTPEIRDENEQNGNSDEGDEEKEEEEYEVDKIMDHKKIRGQLHYLIRWKGYGPEGDTWEPEATLNCPDALSDYKKKSSSAKIPKKKPKLDDAQEEWDENANFEVVRILDVYFRKDGKREFLVAWKGYPNSANSWEPEENMDCKDMIQKFLQKCSQAREAPQKELRVNRKITDRFTLSTKDSGRRLSKRNAGKQRVHYHDAE